MTLTAHSCNVTIEASGADLLNWMPLANGANTDMSSWGELASFLIGATFIAPVVGSILGFSQVWRIRQSGKDEHMASVIATTIVVTVVTSVLCLAFATWIITSRIPMA